MERAAESLDKYTNMRVRYALRLCRRYFALVAVRAQRKQLGDRALRAEKGSYFAFFRHALLELSQISESTHLLSSSAVDHEGAAPATPAPAGMPLRSLAQPGLYTGTAPCTGDAAYQAS
jgi:hypothetical protein